MKKRIEKMTIAELARLNENSGRLVETVRGMSDKVLCCLSNIVNAEMARRYCQLVGKNLLDVEGEE